MCSSLIQIVLVLMVCYSSISIRIPSYAQCEAYNATSQSHLRIVTETQYIQYFVAPCPPGTNAVGNAIRAPGILLTCQEPLPNNSPCSIHSQCSSRSCIQFKCSPPLTQGKCVRDTDAADGFYCKNGIVTAAAPKGGDCSQASNLECFHGYCNAVTKKCDTYENGLISLHLPVISNPDPTGFKSCTLETVETDCVYDTISGKKSAAQLGYGCIPTKFAPSVRYFCQMGGGEPGFVNGAKEVSWFFNFLVGCRPFR